MILPKWSILAFLFLLSQGRTQRTPVDLEGLLTNRLLSAYNQYLINNGLQSKRSDIETVRNLVYSLELNTLSCTTDLGVSRNKWKVHPNADLSAFENFGHPDNSKEGVSPAALNNVWDQLSSRKSPCGVPGTTNSSPGIMNMPPGVMNRPQGTRNDPQDILSKEVCDQSNPECLNPGGTRQIKKPMYNDDQALDSYAYPPDKKGNFPPFLSQGPMTSLATPLDKKGNPITPTHPGFCRMFPDQCARRQIPLGQKPTYCKLYQNLPECKINGKRNMIYYNSPNCASFPYLPSCSAGLSPLQRLTCQRFPFLEICKSSQTSMVQQPSELQQTNRRQVMPVDPNNLFANTLSRDERLSLILTLCKQYSYLRPCLDLKAGYYCNQFPEIEYCQPAGSKKGATEGDATDTPTDEDEPTEEEGTEGASESTTEEGETENGEEGEVTTPVDGEEGGEPGGAEATPTGDAREAGGDGDATSRPEEAEAPAERAEPTEGVAPAEGEAPTEEATPAEGEAPTEEAAPAEGATPADGEETEGSATPEAEGATPAGEAEGTGAPIGDTRSGSRTTKGSCPVGSKRKGCLRQIYGKGPYPKRLCHYRGKRPPCRPYILTPECKKFPYMRQCRMRRPLPQHAGVWGPLPFDLEKPYAPRKIPMLPEEGLLPTGDYGYGQIVPDQYAPDQSGPDAGGIYGPTPYGPKGPYGIYGPDGDQFVPETFGSGQVPEIASTSLSTEEMGRPGRGGKRWRGKPNHYNQDNLRPVLPGPYGSVEYESGTPADMGPNTAGSDSRPSPYGPGILKGASQHGPEFPHGVYPVGADGPFGKGQYNPNDLGQFGPIEPNYHSRKPGRYRPRKKGTRRPKGEGPLESGQYGLGPNGYGPFQKHKLLPFGSGEYHPNIENIHRPGTESGPEDLSLGDVLGDHFPGEKIENPSGKNNEHELSNTKPHGFGSGEFLFGKPTPISLLGGQREIGPKYENGHPRRKPHRKRPYGFLPSESQEGYINGPGYIPRKKDRYSPNSDSSGRPNGHAPDGSVEFDPNINSPPKTGGPFINYPGDGNSGEYAAGMLPGMLPGLLNANGKLMPSKKHRYRPDLFGPNIDSSGNPFGYLPDNIQSGGFDPSLNPESNEEYIPGKKQRYKPKLDSTGSPAGFSPDIHGSSGEFGPILNGGSRQIPKMKHPYKQGFYGPNMDMFNGPGGFLPVHSASGEFGPGPFNEHRPGKKEKNQGPYESAGISGFPGKYVPGEFVPGINVGPGLPVGQLINKKRRPGPYGKFVEGNGIPGEYPPSWSGELGAGEIIPGSSRENLPKHSGSGEFGFGKSDGLSPDQYSPLGKKHKVRPNNPDGYFPMYSGEFGPGVKVGQRPSKLRRPPGYYGEFRPPPFEGPLPEGFIPGQSEGGEFGPPMGNLGKGKYPLGKPGGKGPNGIGKEGVGGYGPVGGDLGGGYGPDGYFSGEMWPYQIPADHYKLQKKTKGKPKKVDFGDGFGSDPGSISNGGKRTYMTNNSPQLFNLAPTPEMIDRDEQKVGVWVGPKGIGDEPVRGIGTSKNPRTPKGYQFVTPGPDGKLRIPKHGGRGWYELWYNPGKSNEDEWIQVWNNKEKRGEWKKKK